jgi:histidinol-phosphate aminotransferase
MERAREPFNVNLLAQEAARAALDDKAFLRKTLRHVTSQKKYLYGQLRRLGLNYVESATNFILVDVGMDCKAAFNALLKEGVIVRDMKAWGWDSYIRVTVGTAAENRKLIAALNRTVGRDAGQGPLRRAVRIDKGAERS